MEKDRKNIPTINIHKKSYERIKQYPLFFFNATEEWNYTTRQIDHFWEAEAIYVSENKRNRLPIGSIDSKYKDIMLTYGVPNAEQLTENNEYISLGLQSFDPKNIEHVKAVLTLFLNKSSDATDKYSLREILWMLNSYYIEIPVLNNAIETFDKQTIQPFFWNALKYYSACLSLPKQRLIQQYLATKGVSSNLYVPQLLMEALDLGFPGIDFSRENRSIFQLIQIAVKSDKYRNREFNSGALNKPTNFFLKVRKWLAVSDYRFEDFESLSHFFRLFSPDTQVLLIKRYFHAIRTGDVEFSEELLKSFQINKFDNWGIYFHCAHEASKPIRLAVPLLCDNILTFLNSGGYALQTINGTLDLAFTQSDINSPEVDFGLKHIVPVCGGGAVPNTPPIPWFHLL